MDARHRGLQTLGELFVVLAMVLRSLSFVDTSSGRNPLFGGLRAELATQGRHERRDSQKLMLSLLGALLLFQCPGAAQLREVRRVLILNELGLWSPGVSAIDKEIFAGLEKSPYQIEFYSEDLDTSLFPDEATQHGFRDWYFRKYQNRKPDLIIAVGPSPIKFMSDSHELFAPGTPIVFWGSIEEFAEPPRLDSDFTGVWGVAQPDQTMTATTMRNGTKLKMH